VIRKRDEVRNKHAIWMAGQASWQCSKCKVWNMPRRALCWNCDEPRKGTDVVALHEGNSYFSTGKATVEECE